MSDYIDRETAIKAMLSRFWDGKETLREIMESVPAADVAPVIHAKWISKYEGDPGECSHCHEFWDGEFDGGECPGHWLTFPDFCPWCGAKMNAE